MSRKRRSERMLGKNVIRHGGPIIELPYDPLEDGQSMERFLRDLIGWTLKRRILPRQASVCRAIVETNLRVSEHGLLEALEKRIEQLENERVPK